MFSYKEKEKGRICTGPKQFFEEHFDDFLLLYFEVMTKAQRQQLWPKCKEDHGS
jgi:hypothetical protein